MQWKQVKIKEEDKKKFFKKYFENKSLEKHMSKLLSFFLGGGAEF